MALKGEGQVRLNRLHASDKFYTFKYEDALILMFP